MSNTQLTELLPWHADIYKRLCDLDKEQKLAHAYLLEGAEGLGKLTLVKHFAHYLLCQSPKEQQPCLECHACHLIAAGSHPDLKLLIPEETRNIKIDQIRETLSFMSNTALRGGRKVIIIAPAEAMNNNASNALLKALEEPTAGTLLLLVSHQPALLMATIKSRCQKLSFACPDANVAIDWLQSKNISGPAEILLKLANGAPLKALHLADEDALHERGVLHSALERLLSGEVTIIEAAAQCDKFDIADNIEGMMLTVVDILEYNQGLQQGKLNDPELTILAAKLKSFKQIQTLHQYYQELLSARSALNSTANPNPQFILESLLYSWSQLEGVKRAEHERRF